MPEEPPKAGLMPILFEVLREHRGQAQRSTQRNLAWQNSLVALLGDGRGLEDLVGQRVDGGDIGI